MNHIEFQPKRLHECAECGDIILDGLVYRLNADEVVCLTCWVEASIAAWLAGFYNQQADR